MIKYWEHAYFKKNGPSAEISAIQNDFPVGCSLIQYRHLGLLLLSETFVVLCMLEDQNQAVYSFITCVWID